MTRHLLPLVLVFLLSPLASLAAQPIDLSEEEFKIARHYQIALEDPRVQKMDPKKRMAAIAHDAGISLKELERAVERSERAGDVKAKCEANIQDEAQGAPLSGRVAKVQVDTGEAHAVAYVEWVNENPLLLEEEASFLAWRAARACGIASSIQLWALDRSNPSVKVFRALISRGAALKINPDRIKDFAQTRYIRLFENVKNATKGDQIEL